MVVRAGSGSDSEVRTALEALCRSYWYPLYGFVRRHGRSHHDAEDCTQEFLARLLSAEGIARARPERGRFRTFLLTALRNFLSNEWRSTQVKKRGGGATIISLDLQDAEQRFLHEPTDSGLTPEQAFDRSWALGLIERAAADLRDEYIKSGRADVFDSLAPLLWGNSHTEPPAALAERLGMKTHALTVALHRLRRRLGERLRAAVAQTVADGAEIDTELRHLIQALGAST